MKTMIDVKHVGIVKSMRHATTRASNAPGSLPHLNLYVYQMNLYKLKKEEKAMTYRLVEVRKQIEHLTDKIQSIRPQVLAAFGTPPKRKQKKGANGENGSPKKRRFNKMTISY